jgi:hypothetical protein
VDTLTIGPAERYDLVLKANNPGLWVMHTHVNDHETNCGRSPGGMETLIVYDGFEDRMGTFAAELPATCNAPPPFTPPPDVQESRVALLDSTPDGLEPSLTVAFPVEPCAVRRLQVKVEARAPDVVLQAANDLEVVLQGPAGGTVRSERLGAGTVLQWTEDYPGSQLALPAGALNLTVRGRAVQTTVQVDVLVDYPASLAELEAAGLDCSTR